MKSKKIPMRRCIVCGTSLPKQELIRIVTGEDGVVVVDPTGRKNGRGAYICRNMDCAAKAGKKKLISAEALEALEMLIKE